jgi:hypothetical protein
MIKPVIVKGTKTRGMETVVLLMQDNEIYETRMVPKGQFFMFYEMCGKEIISVDRKVEK